MRAGLLSLGIAFFALAAPRVAEAQPERIAFLSAKLSQDDDFRVRTNAALALGASNDEAAVTPLCRGLGDGTDVVRQAAAAGLQRLAKPSARGCLEQRMTVEQVQLVRTQLERALAALPAAGASTASGGAVAASRPSTEIVDNPSAKYYVQIAINNRSGRPNEEIDELVRGAVMAKLNSLGSYQVAPVKETPQAAKGSMAKRKLKKGFYLAVSVEPLDRSGGAKANVRVAVFSYPSKNLRAEIPANASSSSAGAEDAVLMRAAENAVTTFAQNVEHLL